jgi:hypothetical protein
MNKGELINDIIDNHLNELYMSLIKYKKKVNNFTKDRVHILIDKITDNNIYIDNYSSKEYKTYKDYKFDLIKLLIYSYSDKNK